MAIRHPYKTFFTLLNFTGLVGTLNKVLLTNQRYHSIGDGLENTIESKNVELGHLVTDFDLGANLDFVEPVLMVQEP
jgi:hypothetical protein